MEIVWRLDGPTLDIANTECPPMQLHHFLHKVEPQAGALATAVRPRQGVETLAQAWQRIVGNRCGLIEQADLDPIAAALGADAQQAVDGGEVQGVFQQIAQGLTQQKWLAGQHQVGCNVLFNAQLATFDPTAARFQQLIHQCRQRHRDFFFQPLALLDLGQVEQPFDQLLHAHTFVADVTDEALVLGSRHIALQQFGGTANRRQRTLELVGQGMHVTLDVSLAFELGAHVFHGARQLLELATAIMRHFHPTPLADRLGIGRQPSQRRAEPPGQQAAQQQAQGHQSGAIRQQPPLGAIDIRL